MLILPALFVILNTLQVVSSKCTGGQIYKSCGSACTRTCDNRNPICTKQCVAKCECPKDMPYWDGNKCLDEDQCDCRLPPKQGPCNFHTPRWYYNKKSKKCEKFSYGGCYGNANNYLCEKECHKKCDESGCPFRDCSSTFCPAGVKLKKNCKDKKCKCNCPCKKKTCKPGYHCIAVEKKCKNPPCKLKATCVEQLCKYGSPLEDVTCSFIKPCPRGYSCTTTSAGKQVCCADSVCQLPPDSGCGKKNAERWYYDQASQSCKTFRYALEAGNGNNFMSEKECLDQCQPNGCQPLCCDLACQYGYAKDQNGCKICKCLERCPGVSCGVDEELTLTPVVCITDPCPPVCTCDTHPCLQPMEVGQCRAAIPRYFFNSKTQRCELFSYGGCGGNNNNFMTLEECLGTCTDYLLCPLLGFCFTKCPYGLRPRDDGCILCDCFDPCHDKCCPEGEVCQVMNAHCEIPPCPLGVATCVPKKCSLGFPLKKGDLTVMCSDKSPCPRGYQCEGGVCCASVICALPADSGPCTDYNNYYYYDIKANSCKEFLYGGCGGNVNRFKTLADCENRCKCQPILCQKFCKDGFKKDEKGCEICECV